MSPTNNINDRNQINEINPDKPDKPNKPNQPFTLVDVCVSLRLSAIKSKTLLFTIQDVTPFTDNDKKLLEYLE